MSLSNRNKDENLRYKLNYHTLIVMTAQLLMNATQLQMYHTLRK